MATKVKVDVSADGTGFHRQMGSVEKRLKGVGTLFKAAFTGVVVTSVVRTLTQSVTAIANKTAEMADNAAKFAKNMGVSIEQGQAFSFIAEQSGVDKNVMADAINKYRDAVGKAGRGDKKATDAFAALGLTPQQDPVKGLQQLAASNPNINANFTSLKALIGEQAVKSFGAWNQEMARFNEILGELHSKGMIFTAEDAAAIEVFKDKWDELMRTFYATFGPVVGELAQMGAYAAVALQGLLLALKELGSEIQVLARISNMAGGNVLAWRESFMEAIGIDKDSPFSNVSSEHFARAREQLEAAKKRADDLQNIFKAYEDRLRNPPAPNSPNDDEQSKKPVKSTLSDSMVSVGNFLGVGTASLTSLTKETNNILIQIRQELYLSRMQEAYKLAQSATSSLLHLPVLP